MQTLALLDVVRDPSLIPFVYDYCDQWCRRCPAAAQCLYYRTRDAVPRPDPREPVSPAAIEALLDEGTRFAKTIAEATASPVAELDYDLTDPGRSPGAPAIGDPLERLAREYMLRANRFLFLSGMDLSRDPYHDEVTPEKVIVWHHMLIASKTYRALAAADRARQGVDLAEDALASAKLVLVSIDESIRAIAIVGRRRTDSILDQLTSLLVTLRCGIEERFPGARQYLRAGLDAAVTG